VSYPLAQLGQVATIEREGIDPGRIRSGARYVGLEHIDSSGAIRAIEVSNGELASTKFAFTAEHLLFGKLRPYLRKIARPQFEGICSTDIIPIRPGEKVDRGYLFHFLRLDEVVDKAASLATGANLPRLSPLILEKFELPLPPIDEQRRIAAILDQADDLRRKRRVALELLKKVKRVSFEAMFLKPELVFPRGTIGDLTASTQYGTSSKASDAGDFAILRMGNLTIDGDVDCRDLKRMDLAPGDVSKYTVVPGDILFNRTNSPELVGKTAVFREQGVFAFAGYLVRLRVNERAEPDYVSAYLNSKRGKTILRGMCKAIIGMANINAQELRGISIPLPPLDLQRAFAARVAEIDKLKAHHRAHLARLDALFASLQHRAFRGEL